MPDVAKIGVPGTTAPVGRTCTLEVPEPESAPLGLSSGRQSAAADSAVTPRPKMPRACKLVVIWIDWYSYHVARFRALTEHPALHVALAGVELVGGVGVHAGQRFRETLPADLPVHTLEPNGSWHTVSQRALAAKLWTELTRLDPEAVLVPGYYTLPGVAAALWARVHNRCSILMTESTAADHRRSGWKESVKGLLLRTLFDRAIAGGTPHVRYLEQLGFPAERIAFGYDVVDNRFFGEQTALIRKEHAASKSGRPNEPYFLYVGRLAPEKNVDGLVKAYFSYRQQGGDWPLVLVGDGPSAPALRALAAESPEAPIVFAGHKGSAELPPYYAFAGSFVLPSTREPWGLVVNEAMAAGLPIVVSNRCGCAEDLVRTGHNGFTFDPSDLAGFVDALTRVSTLNDSDRAAMGRNSQLLVQEFSPERWASEVVRIAELDTQSTDRDIDIVASQSHGRSRS